MQKNLEFMKYRLDKLILDKGIISSRQRAKALIMEGKVFVNNIKIIKAGSLFAPDSNIEVKENNIPYVSRGGLKLEFAIKHFNILLQDKIAMDIGSSTGGFTDCMLQKGVKRVYAIDVGYGQMDWKLRQNEKVVLIERTNIRYLEPQKIPEKIDIAVIDLSFISLTKIIIKTLDFLKSSGEIVALIKPQFEVGKGEVDKGGIVKDEAKRIRAVEKIKEYFKSCGIEIKGVIPSPILGQKGNTEYLLYGLSTN